MRIRGLAKLIGLLIQVCKVIGLYGSTIRLFVPDDKKSIYDSALSAITSACDALRSINYADEVPQTNPAWGAKDTA